MSATEARPAAPSAAPALSGAAPWRNLVMATLGFTINFWAWNLIGPLGPTFGKNLGLSPGTQSLLVAVPVIVGALGRVPVGALTDKLGARVMFPLVSFLTIIPVLLLIPAKDSLPALLGVGFLLGLGGTTFAIGVPLVTPGSRRPAAAPRSASSAWAWAAPRCRPTSPRGWSPRTGWTSRSCSSPRCWPGTGCSPSCW
jgi:MFS family permease